MRLAVRDELQRALAPLLPPALDPRQAELLAALADVVGTAPFSSDEALDLARRPLPGRRRLLAAIEATGATDAQGLGLVLAAVVRRTRGRLPRLVRAGAEAGSRVWAVEGGPKGS